MSAGQITDEAEAWLVLAELIEGGQMLPEWVHMDGAPSMEGCCSGLCDVLEASARGDVLNVQLLLSMRDRVSQALGDKAYLATAYAWKPRVKWCRRFAAQVLKERRAT